MLLHEAQTEAGRGSIEQRLLIGAGVGFITGLLPRNLGRWLCWGILAALVAAAVLLSVQAVLGVQRSAVDIWILVLAITGVVFPGGLAVGAFIRMNHERRSA